MLVRKKEHESRNGKTCKWILRGKEWTEVLKWTSAKWRAHQDLSESVFTDL